MEYQFRRGIYRPNAQRLSISLAPLVAQRSLMFRVKTDLATEACYAELAPTEESPALYSLSESAQIVSAVLTAMSVALSTAMSSASVYSQDSWKTESPFVPVVKVDPRRMAIAFSPSVQWSDIVEGDSDEEFAVKTPLVQSPFISQPHVSFSEVKEENDTVRGSIKGSLDVGSRSPFEKIHTVKIKSKSKKTDEQNPKRSKSSKAFRKFMAHLSFQPSKRELAQLRRADAVAMSDNLPLVDLKLPEIRMSPIRYSFIAQTNAYPSIPHMPSAPSSMALSFDTIVEEDGEDVVRVRQLRGAIPSSVTSPKKKGRRRFHSSPAVPYFRRWDKDNMPPLPPMPAGPLKPIVSGPVSISL